MDTPNTGKRGREYFTSDSSPDLPSKMANLQLTEERVMELMRKVLDEKLKPVQMGVNGLEKTVAELKAQILGYQEERKVLIANNNWLKFKLDEANDKHDNDENRARRSNIVFSGIPEKLDGRETEAILRRTISDFCQEKLGILGVLDNQMRTHRIGQQRNNAKYPRRVIALIPNNICHTTIFENANKLKGTNFGVDRDYSDRLRCIRRAYFLFRKKVFPLGLKVRVVFDHFYMNDLCFYVGKNSNFLLCDDQPAGVVLERFQGLDVHRIIGIWQEASACIVEDLKGRFDGWINFRPDACDKPTPLLTLSTSLPGSRGPPKKPMNTPTTPRLNLGLEPCPISELSAVPETDPSVSHEEVMQQLFD